MLTIVRWVRLYQEYFWIEAVARLLEIWTLPAVAR